MDDHLAENIVPVNTSVGAIDLNEGVEEAERGRTQHIFSHIELVALS